MDGSIGVVGMERGVVLSGIGVVLEGEADEEWF